MAHLDWWSRLRSRAARAIASRWPAPRDDSSVRDDPGSVRLALALAKALMRQLLWGRRLILREVAMWRAMAIRIPDEDLRAYALASIREKRNLAMGAGFFSILPSGRNPALVRLLVTYQLMWDFLDLASERMDSEGHAAGYQLHAALTDALAPDSPASDYYRLFPGRDDGGYVRAMVEVCRAECAGLPSYPQVEAAVLEGVAGCTVQAINHDEDAERREASLKRWATDYVRGEAVGHLPWFERTAAASAFMPHPLLALASERDCREDEVQRTRDAYFPWMSLAIVMLDSYVDRKEDLVRGDHSYLSYYGDEQLAIDRLTEIIGSMAAGMSRLPDGAGHAVIAVCMVAMYLAQDGAHAPDMRTSTARLARAYGGKVGMALNLLRISRRLHQSFRVAGESSWSGTADASLEAVARC